MKNLTSALLGSFFCLNLFYSPIYPEGAIVEPEDKQHIEEVIEQPVYGPEEAPEEEVVEEPKVYTSEELAEIALPAIVAITVDYSYLDWENIHERARTMGSGVFISSNGHILTCAHLFEGIVDRITIEMQNGYIVSGELLNVSYTKDLALVKVYEEDTEFLTVSEEDVKIGQKIYAAGHPLGLMWTFTQGIVSGLDRKHVSKQDLIQTDAVINPGSSGGPLVNVMGEIVGINVRIKGNFPIPNWSGQGFAVAPHELRDYLDKFRGL